MLDLGCGAGRFVAALRDAGADPVGVELADGALERARRNVPGADLRAMTDEIPLEDASVDLVWCSEVLEHVPDTAGLLSEVRRVLKTGGRLLATTPSPPPRRAPIALLRWEEHFDPLGQHVRFYSRRSLTRTLETFAFEGVEVSSQRGHARRPRPQGAAVLAAPELAHEQQRAQEGHEHGERELERMLLRVAPPRAHGGLGSGNRRHVAELRCAFGNDIDAPTAGLLDGLDLLAGSRGSWRRGCRQRRADARRGGRGRRLRCITRAGARLATQGPQRAVLEPSDTPHGEMQARRRLGT